MDQPQDEFKNIGCYKQEKTIVIREPMIGASILAHESREGHKEDIDLHYTPWVFFLYVLPTLWAFEFGPCLYLTGLQRNNIPPQPSMGTTYLHL